jgi:hypothetical protein
MSPEIFFMFLKNKTSWKRNFFTFCFSVFPLPNFPSPIRPHHSFRKEKFIINNYELCRIMLLISISMRHICKQPWELNFELLSSRWEEGRRGLKSQKMILCFSNKQALRLSSLHQTPSSIPSISRRVHSSIVLGRASICNAKESTQEGEQSLRNWEKISRFGLEKLENRGEQVFVSIQIRLWTPHSQRLALERTRLPNPVVSPSRT